VPDDVRVHNNLGNVYAEKGDKCAAASEYRIALRLDPTFTDARENLEGLAGDTPRSAGMRLSDR
jgi:Flp pilus assembly protein TadD